MVAIFSHVERPTPNYRLSCVDLSNIVFCLTLFPATTPGCPSQMIDGWCSHYTYRLHFRSVFS